MRTPGPLRRGARAVRTLGTEPEKVDDRRLFPPSVIDENLLLPNCVEESEGLLRTAEGPDPRVGEAALLENQRLERRLWYRGERIHRRVQDRRICIDVEDALVVGKDLAQEDDLRPVEGTFLYAMVADHDRVVVTLGERPEGRKGYVQDALHRSGPHRGQRFHYGCLRMQSWQGSTVRLFRTRGPYAGVMAELPVTRIETPTPWGGVGPVNAYLIEATPITLVDSGFNSPAGQNALRLVLAGRELFLESIERILVTHGHPDHYGMVSLIQEHSGARVHFPAHEIKRVVDPEMLIRTGRLLVEAGMPLEMLFKMNKQRRQQPGPRVQQDQVVPVHDGDRFEFDGFELIAYDMPGHTGGHVVYLEPETRTLFAGDQLLPKTSPNPLLEPSLDDPEERRRSLKDYLASLHKMAAMDLTLVYPGHGDPVTDPGELIRSTLEHHEKRKAEVAGYLTGDGQSPFEIAERMFPDKMEYEAFLAVSEVVAHLDLVVDDGEAVTEERDGVVYYAAAR